MSNKHDLRVQKLECVCGVVGDGAVVTRGKKATLLILKGFRV